MSPIADDERVGVLAALVTLAIVTTKTVVQILKARKDKKA